MKCFNFEHSLYKASTGLSQSDDNILSLLCLAEDAVLSLNYHVNLDFVDSCVKLAETM